MAKTDFYKLALGPEPPTPLVIERESFSVGDTLFRKAGNREVQLVKVTAWDGEVLTVEQDDGSTAEIHPATYPGTLRVATVEDVAKFRAEEAAELEEAAKQAAAEVEERRQKNVIRRSEIDLTVDPEEVPVRYIVKGLLPAGVNHAIVGRYGAGKSLVGPVDLAGSVAMGLPWLGYETVQGSVRVLVLEGTMEAYVQRLAAWCQARNVDRAELAKWLKVSLTRLFLIAPPKTVTTTDGETGETVERVVQTTDRSESLSALLQVVLQDKPSLLVIDNFRGATRGFSNMSEKNMGDAIAALEELTAKGQTTVMTVGHTNLQDDKWIGLTALEDAMDTVLHVKQTGTSTQRTLFGWKNREQARTDPVCFTIDPVGNSAVVQMGEGDVAKVYAAMRALGEPASKTAILSQLREMGGKIRKQDGLALISSLADDEDDPVRRVGDLYTIDFDVED